MKYLNKFETTEDYNQAIEQELSILNHYVAKTEDNQTIHLKPIPNIFYVTTNNTGTRIYKRTDSSFEELTLKNGENILKDWEYGFYFDYNMKADQITSFDVSKFNTSKVTYMDDMFSYCSSLTSLDLSSFNTSNVTAMDMMFYQCTNLTSLDLSNFDTSKVTRMDSMFSQCTNLTSLDLSSFDTSNVTKMNSMFIECSGLTSLDLSKFDTSKVTNMNNMFDGCSGLTSLDLSSFNTTNVKNMQSMFSQCTNLTSLDLSNFDTSKVTNMSSMYAMFGNCIKLTHIKCKQAFKDWCKTNKTNISLPEAMVNGTVGNDSSYNWEIVDYSE